VNWREREKKGAEHTVAGEIHRLSLTVAHIDGLRSMDNAAIIAIGNRAPFLGSNDGFVSFGVPANGGGVASREFVLVSFCRTGGLDQ
jgi:hypothetical protein